MKKFWSIFTVALVALSAVSCSNNFEEEVVLGGETLSFNVNIDNTRTALKQQDENSWNTVWVGNETLVVSDGQVSYNFSNTEKNTNKFTCTAEGVLSLVGKRVEVVYNPVINSAAGAAGMTLAGAAEEFGAHSAVELSAGNAFLKLTSTADVTLTASKNIFGDGSARLDRVTVKGENVLVPIYADGNVTLSAIFEDVPAKSASLTFVNNKIYNLGTLEAPEASKVWGTAGKHNGWAAENPGAVYEKGEYIVAYNFAGGTEFKFVKNKSWAVSVGGAGTKATQANVWTDTGGNNIILPSGGPYDVYLLPSFKYCVVEAGKTPEKFDAETYDLYLKPNSNWMQANARFAAYFFKNDNSGNVWANMTTVADGIYGVKIPDGYTSSNCKVIFCRMNPSATANDWSNKWNQTGDLKIPTDGKNLYTINNGSWDAGTWSVKQ